MLYMASRPGAGLALALVIVLAGCGRETPKDSAMTVTPRPVPSSSTAASTASAAPVPVIKLPKSLEPGHKGNMLVALAPDSKRLVSAGLGDRTMKFWDLQTGNLLWQATGLPNLPMAFAFSPSGRLLVVSGAVQFLGDGIPVENVLRVWDTQTGQELPPFQGRHYGCRTIAFGPDDKLLLSGHNDYHMRLWDVASRRELRSFRTSEVFVMGVAMSPDSQRGLLTDGKTMSLWDLRTGAAIREIAVANVADRSVIHAQVFWLPDGRHAVYMADTGLVRIWDMDKGAEVRNFQAQEGPANLSLSADYRHGFTAGYDKRLRAPSSLRVWDLASGKQVQTLDDPYGRGRALMSPDGRFAACWGTMGSNGPIRLIELGK